MNLEKNKDEFLSKLLKKNVFIFNSNKLNLEKILSNKKHLLILKTKKKISLNIKKKYDIYVRSKLITYKKNTKTLRHFKNENKLQLINAKKNHIKQINSICKQNIYGSRFQLDKNIKLSFLINYRVKWIKNFFLGKRADYLFVAISKKKIVKGFILIMLRKSNIIIDQIVVGNKYKKKGVGSFLINESIKKLKNKPKFIFASTYQHNKGSIKMYEKLNFKQTDYKFIYHLYLKK